MTGHLERIWGLQRAKEFEQNELKARMLRGWSGDLRWRKVWAEVKPVEDVLQDRVQILVEVHFDGQIFSCLCGLDSADMDTFGTVMDDIVAGIDRLMERSGRPPYEIRSHA